MAELPVAVQCQLKLCSGLKLQSVGNNDGVWRACCGARRPDLPRTCAGGVVQGTLFHILPILTIMLPIFQLLAAPSGYEFIWNE